MKVLVFAGQKQSGKTSGAQFVSAYILSQIARLNDNSPLSKRFNQTDDGKIVVDTVDDKGNKIFGELDFSRKDEQFTNFAKQYIWPYVKIYSFADELKKISMSVFGLTKEQCYGTNADKNSLTKIKWEDMLKLFHPTKARQLKNEGFDKEFMTAREFNQYFGTDVCRRLYDDCWINSCFSAIERDNPEIAIIDDCRFYNEVLACDRYDNVKKIRLLRKIDDANDTHESESAILEVESEKFNRNIDNNDMNIKEKNQIILDSLYSWGWLTEHIPY